LAQSALDFATAHARERAYAHTGQVLAEVPAIQARIADMWLAVQQARYMIYQAADRGDLQAPDALPFILAAKALAADAAVNVTNEAMTVTGGQGYRENSMLWTLLHDARASHVMSPTTDMLKQWLGRDLLGLPLLAP
ncbi:MAG: acyl-CoA dehydrogenase family protein, partial [Candidatus Sericytochromatia bacterium]